MLLKSRSFAIKPKPLTIMSKKITRSTVNEQQYSAPEFPTSGFPLSYRRYFSAMLGRIHVGGFHYVMPGDKISGKTTGNNITFKRIVTSIVSPVNAMQYNIYIPFRPLDRSFQKGFVPTKLNAMSANWSMPTVTTRYLVDQIMRAYFNIAYNATITDINGLLQSVDAAITNHGANATLQDLCNEYNETLDNVLYSLSTIGLVKNPLDNLMKSGSILTNMADQMYMRDALLDIAESITAKLGSSEYPLSGSMLLVDFLNLYFSTLLTPFVGRYSYFAEFKYEFLRPFDFYRISRGLTNSQYPNNYTDFLGLFSDTPQNEYALRAMYGIWYELFRNIDLEPVSNTLPDWREWSSTSIFDMSAGGNLLYLIYRIRPWEKDMFISAQIDDLSRHVYAPIFGVTETDTAGHIQSINNFDTNNNVDPADSFSGGSKPSIYGLTYRDQLTDTPQTINCPVPANINDVLSSLDNSFVDVYGLDLNTLRQSQMLEKYLKRNYLFGDEYQDRFLAHYNSRISDARINRPEILSQSLDEYDLKQEVSNLSTDAVAVRSPTLVPASVDTFDTSCFISYSSRD